MNDGQEFRCRRAERCSASVTLMDPVTGERLERVGAELVGRDVPLPKVRGSQVERDPVPGSLYGLCNSCTSEVDYALAGVPMDVIALSILLPRHLAGSSGERGEITRPAPGPLAPWQEPIYALLELIVHETTVWAEITDDHAGSEEWDSGQMAHTRVPFRVGKACALLQHHLGLLLSLGPQEYMAGSLPDLEQATRRGRASWIERDGVDAGLQMLSLHDSALAAGSHVNRPDHLSMPCRNRGCYQFGLLHWPGSDEVFCVECRSRWKWDDYVDLRSILTGTAAG